MNYGDWLKTISEEIASDSIWKVEVYRLSLFFAEVCWHDVAKLSKEARTRSIADQLYRSVGSIGGNIAEGYSRGSGKDRARFYEYALGSARESRHWYYMSGPILGDAVANHRFSLLSNIIKLLLTMIPQQRGSELRETPVDYRINEDALLDDLETNELLKIIPHA